MNQEKILEKKSMHSKSMAESKVGNAKKDDDMEEEPKDGGGEEEEDDEEFKDECELLQLKEMEILEKYMERKMNNATSELDMNSKKTSHLKDDASSTQHF